MYAVKTIKVNIRESLGKNELKVFHITYLDQFIFKWSNITTPTSYHYALARKKMNIFWYHKKYLQMNEHI